jgi:hypothetical protein
VAEDALALTRRYGALATIARVQKGLLQIADADRSPGALLAMGLVQGTLPSNRKAFQAELAKATPKSRAKLARMAKAIQQSI